MGFCRFFKKIGTIAVAFLFMTGVLAADPKQSNRKIQEALAGLGYNIGVVDGVWGKRSANALTAFQIAEGLWPTGKPDTETQARLFGKGQGQGVVSATGTLSPGAGANNARLSSSADIATPHQPAVPLAVPPNDAERPPASIAETARIVATSSTAPSASHSSGGVAGLALLGIMGGGLFWLIRRGRRVRAEESRRAIEASVAAWAVEMERPVTAATVPSRPGAITVVVKDASPVEAQPPQLSPVSERAKEASIAVLPAEMERPAATASVPSRPATITVAMTAASHVERNLSKGFYARPLTKSLTTQQDCWVIPGVAVKVGQQNITGGMIYVGTHLPQQGDRDRPENCLINPRLNVAAKGDPSGNTMSYWPSYSDMTGQARKSYLDWLSGSRADPNAYIGFVFLYFYGLERRLLLEDNAPDAEDVLNEVRRLLAIYGEHYSFRRYASALVAACDIKCGATSSIAPADVAHDGYDVPLNIKMELGRKAKNGECIEPDLLLSYVMAHPETRVRTPAKRALPQLRQLFADAVAQQYPKGLRIPVGRAKALVSQYQSCSGTFGLDLKPAGMDVPDVTNRVEPLATGRRLFENCVEQLDDYSRTLGRMQGRQPTLIALARLPHGYRLSNARLLASEALTTLTQLAETGRPETIAQLAEICGVDLGATANRARLKELAATLAAMGFGCSDDPSFTLKPAKADDKAVLFSLAGEATSPPAPSDAYRHAQLSLMLGMLMAGADGHFDALERQILLDRIDRAAGLDTDDRLRLRAEMQTHEATPGRLSEWIKKLKDAAVDVRQGLADELVALATIDGIASVHEVALLETLFRRMGLTDGDLYGRLHDSSSLTPVSHPDDDLTLLIAPGAEMAGIPIHIPAPQPPAAAPRPAVRVDPSRLAAIRSETRHASSVLASIFAEDDATDVIQATAHSSPKSEPESEPAPDVVEAIEGLDGRYAGLLAALADREEWTASDFAQLTRVAGLMPGAARQVLNEWALDRFDDLLLEGDDPVLVNRHYLPERPSTALSASLSASDARVSA